MHTIKGPRLSGKTARDKAAASLLRLHAVEAESAHITVQELLTHTLRHTTDPRDAALCTELVYGVLRWELRLEWILKKFLSKPEKLPPAVMMVLLAASYELLFLTRIPAHATVNWAVGAVCTATGAGLGRVANAVLRRVAELGEKAHSPAWYAEDTPSHLHFLSIFYAIPLWILELWHTDHALEDVEHLAAASSITPSPTLRLNQGKPQWEETLQELEKHGGSRVAHSGIRFAPGKTPQSVATLVQEGCASWHGAGSQELLAGFANEAWEGPVWDACAGRGGKTCMLLEMGKNVALASDPHSRIHSLGGELQRLGLPKPMLVQSEAQTLVPEMPINTILLDVPCSGLGTLSRRPDTRIFRTASQVMDLISLQATLLEHAWSLLPVGGSLLYMTCTVNKAENEAQMHALQARHPEARILKEHCTRGEYGADIMYGALVHKDC